MSVLTLMYGEQLDSFKRAARRILQGAKELPAPASERDRKLVQDFLGRVTQSGKDVAEDLAAAWDWLKEGRINDPKKEGQRLLHIAQALLDLLEKVEDDWREMNDKGVVSVNLSPIARARRQLASEVERMRSAWPMITAQQIGELEIRRAAGAAALDAHEADEASLPGWEHLVRCRHPWRQQPSLKGRNLTVRHVIGHVAANRLTEKQAAEDLGLPVEAVREALRYARKHARAIDEDTACEQYILAKEGPRRGTVALPR